MDDTARAAGLRPGTVLDRYILLRRLAVGGMAELYIAQQRGAAGFSKIVALKRILSHLAEDPTFTRMFLDEARLASGLTHPNLAQVLDFGEFDGEYFLTMEYVHGRNLLQLLRAQDGRTLPLACSLSIVAAVGRGLHDLHEQTSPDGRPLGLVHRDVSPSNVLVSFDGKVKLTDFGIAKAMELTSATRSGTFKGKLGHSSPEQARGETIDRRSDVFCLGILLYEATTGARAFSGPNEFAVLGKVARGAYEPPEDVAPGYPEGVSEIVARALAVDPDDRYPTAAAVADAIETFAVAEGLRLGEDIVHETMRALFGPAPPVVVSAELEMAEQAEASMSAAAGSLSASVTNMRTRVLVPEVRRSRAVYVAIPLALVVGATAAWAVARRDLPAPPAAAPIPAEPSAVVVPAPVVVPTPTPMLVAEPDAEDAEDTEDADEDTTDEVESDVEAAEPTTKRRHRKKKRPRKKRPRADGGGGLDGLYPPGE